MEILKRSFVISLLLSTFYSSSVYAQSPAAEAQPFNLEFGLGVGGGHGEQGLPRVTARGLFSAILGYHLESWFLGITTRGAYSTSGDTKIRTTQTLDAGDLVHRTIEYGLIARRYLVADVGGQWYGQLGAGIVYNEAIADDSTLTPKPIQFINRFYLDGTWLQASIGREFANSPWFMRLEFTYSFYYQSKVIGTEAGVNRAMEEYTVLGNPHEQIFTFVVGLANIF